MSAQVVLACLAAGAAVFTQSPRDPGKDLTMTFSSRHSGGEPGSVFGVVKNRSAQLYPCVRIDFDLSTRFDLRQPGQAAASLGQLTVELHDLQPQEARSYEQPLPRPAGVALRAVSECGQQPKTPPRDAPRILAFTVAPARIAPGQTATLEWRTSNADRVLVGEANPGWPNASADAIRAPKPSAASGSLQITPAATATYRIQANKGAVDALRDVTIEVTSAAAPLQTCSISGRVSGKLQWDAKDDRGQPVSFSLTEMMLTAGAAGKRERAPLQGRTYEFANVPAGQSYKVVPWSSGPSGGKFRSAPAERSVVCQPNGKHTGVDFTITGPPASG